MNKIVPGFLMKPGNNIHLSVEIYITLIVKAFPGLGFVLVCQMVCKRSQTHSAKRIVSFRFHPETGTKIILNIL